MTRPSVYRAFIERLIDDAMKAAGWSEPTRSELGATYWPPRPQTTPVTIRIDLGARTITDTPFTIAQRLIDEALANASKEAA